MTYQETHYSFNTCKKTRKLHGLIAITKLSDLKREKLDAFDLKLAILRWQLIQIKEPALWLPKFWLRSFSSTYNVQEVGLFAKENFVFVL